jgi:uncharacterized protein
VRIPWPILLVALVLPTAGALVYFVAASPDDPLFKITYTGSKIVQFALPVVALYLFDRSRLRGVTLSTKGLGSGVLVGLATAAAIIALYALAFRGGPTFETVGSEVRAKVAGFGLGSPAGFVVLALGISIAHSFLEEYYWRWFVHAELRERLPWAAAVLLSSAAFAAHHVVVLDVYFPGRFWTATVPFSLAVMLGGVIWAWGYDRTGSLAGPWAAHVGADVGLMAVGYDLLFGW